MRKYIELLLSVLLITGIYFYINNRSSDEYFFEVDGKKVYGSTTGKSESINCSEYVLNDLVVASDNLHKGKLEEAERLLTEIIEKEPLCTNALLNLGTVYFFKKEYDSAEKYFRKILELTPNSSLAYKALGLLYDHNESIPYFKKAIELDPQNTLLYWNIGVSYYMTTKFELAKENLNLFLRIEPSSIHAPRAKEILQEINEYQR